MLELSKNNLFNRILTNIKSAYKHSIDFAFAPLAFSINYIKTTGNNSPYNADAGLALLRPFGFASLPFTAIASLVTIPIGAAGLIITTMMAGIILPAAQVTDILKTMEGSKTSYKAEPINNTQQDSQTITRRIDMQRILDPLLTKALKNRESNDEFKKLKKLVANHIQHCSDPNIDIDLTEYSKESVEQIVQWLSDNGISSVCKSFPDADGGIDTFLNITNIHNNITESDHKIEKDRTLNAAWARTFKPASANYLKKAPTPIGCDKTTHEETKRIRKRR